MKAQISRLEAWIKKIQEKVNEDLEELKNRQSAMNTIIEIKNTIAGTNSRITEAEEQTSEPESRMIKISEAKQNKGKRIKRNEEVSEISGTTLSGQTFELQGSQKKKEKKWHEKIFEITVENFPNIGKELACHDQEAQRVHIG